MTFRGFDTSVFPGDNVILDAVAHGFTFTCPYLEAPSHSHSNWPSYATLRSLGISPFPVWVGGQVVGPGSHLVGYQYGLQEAENCIRAMQSLGYPVGHGVAFDVENGPPTPPNQVAHLTAWHVKMACGPYRPMIYCSHLLFAQMAEIFGAQNVWTFDLRSQTPAILGCAVQYEQDVMITLANQVVRVDLDLATTADPAAQI